MSSDRIPYIWRPDLGKYILPEEDDRPMELFGEDCLQIHEERRQLDKDNKRYCTINQIG